MGDLSMDFDIFDEEEERQNEPVEEDKENDEAVSVHDSLFEGLKRFTQRTQFGIQIQDDGEIEAPRNEFEQELCNKYEVQLRRNADNNKLYFYLGQMNHKKFVRRLDDALDEAEGDRLVNMFISCMTDRLQLLLFMSPMQSCFGEQDTLFRAFLLCKTTQKKAFENIMEHMEKLGGANSPADSVQLAEVAVCHIRYLDYVYDPEAIYGIVFDKSFEDWKASVRDAFIVAIPEIFGDPVTQQKAAVSLLDLMFKDISDSPLDFKLALINTLKLLRTDKDTQNRIRKTLLRHVSDLEPQAIIEVISLVMDSLDKDLDAMMDCLVLMGQTIKWNEIKKTRGNKGKTKDEVACESMNKITQFVEMGGKKIWNEIVCFLRYGKRKLDNEEDEEGSESEATSATKLKDLSLFDVMLGVSLMGSSRVPPSIFGAIKAHLNARELNIHKFNEIWKLLFGFNKFCTTYMSVLIRLAKSFMWTPNETMRQFGAFLYQNLFISFVKSRDEVVDGMLSHFGGHETECFVLLEMLSTLARSHSADLLPYAKRLLDIESIVDRLSLRNVRVLFHVLFRLSSDAPSSSSVRSEVDGWVGKMCVSLMERERMCGLVGLLVQLRVALTTSSSNRDMNVPPLIEKIQNTVSQSDKLRVVMYNEMTEMFKSEMRNMPKFGPLLQWGDQLLATFKEFFVIRNKEKPTSGLEGARFVDEGNTQWLEPKDDRIIELCPLFLLLKEFYVLKRRYETDDTQEAVVSYYDQFSFVLKANISMRGISSAVDRTRLPINSTRIFHYINLIRVMLNTFTEEDVPRGDTTLDALKSKKFALLCELQKTLAVNITEMGRLSIPSTDSTRNGFIVIHEKRSANKRGRKAKAGKNKKKRGNENETGDAPEEGSVGGEEEPGDETQEKSEEQNPLLDTEEIKITMEQLPKLFHPFKLRTVAYLMRLSLEKRKQQLYLMQTFHSIIQIVLPKKEKKDVPWEMVRRFPVDDLPSNWHGDSSSIWKCIHRSFPVLLNMLSTSCEYFADDSGNRRDDVFPQMCSIFSTALSILTHIFAWKEQNRRMKCMEQLEKSILEMTNSQKKEGDEAEHTVFKYLLGLGNRVPTMECGRVFLDVCAAIEDRDEDADRQLARYALNFLRKEWKEQDDEQLKGAALTRPVAAVVEHYVSFRSMEDRLTVILWLLAQQLTLLASESERRESRIGTIHSSPDEFPEGFTEGELFPAINKETFSAVYRTLFAALNNTTAKILTKCSRSDEWWLSKWRDAVNAFTLFALFLRVKKLRSITMMGTALREGKRFLILFTKKGSFLDLLRDEHSFSLISNDVIAIIKAMQLGNRTLQYLSVYAKSERSKSLLGKVPELRCAGETWMRSLHAALARVGASQAFQIGLLKSRNIDGEEIVYEGDPEKEVPSEGEAQDELGQEGEEEMDNTQANKSMVF